MASCHHCEEPAVLDIARRGRSYCASHLTRFVHGAVMKATQPLDGSEDQVAVGISGGKDSAALLSVLHRLGHDVVPVTVDLGISGYADPSVQACRDLCDQLGLDLHVIDLQEVSGYDIDLVSRHKDRPCATCGLGKRYHLNRFAHERGIPWVATGHTLTDEAAVLLWNLRNGQVRQLVRAGHALPPDPDRGMAGRIKPLTWLMERETFLYCVIHDLPFHGADCPHAGGDLMAFKDDLLKLEGDQPGFLRDTLEGWSKLPLGEHPNAPVVPCTACGMPTFGETCRMCREAADWRRVAEQEATP